MACEKCWGDAYHRMRFVDPTRSQHDHYRDLLEERKDNPCTPEEQEGKHPCAYCGKMSKPKYCSNACEDDAYDERHVLLGRAGFMKTKRHTWIAWMGKCVCGCFCCRSWGRC